jgi:hypothetical protein
MFTVDSMQTMLAQMHKAETEVLERKRREYVGEDGYKPLSNIHFMASINAMRPEEVATVLLSKHLLGLSRLVQGKEKLELSMVRPDGTEGLLQRILDARNYLFLLACLVEEGRLAGNPSMSGSGPQWSAGAKSSKEGQ